MLPLRTLFFAGVAAAGLGILLWRYAVQPSKLITDGDGVYFPTVSGSNLDRQAMELPHDFGGELNLLFVPFLQEQQTVVNTWIPFAEELEASFAGLIYYELPTIRRMPMVSRTFINEGMRAGIPDPKARQRTITLYIDLEQFMQATGISGNRDVHVLLVNRSGDILWRTIGRFSPEKGEALRRAVEASR